MSQPRRYIGKAIIHPTNTDNLYDVKAVEDANGNWVAWEDYEKLQAEVERLNEIVRREVDGGVDLREEAQRTVEENHKLRAEVNRLNDLIVAGNAIIPDARPINTDTP